MPNAANVSTGKPKITGAVYRAPLGTTLPVDASTTLAAAFKELGYVSEDGVTNTNSPESDSIKEWGGSKVLVYQSEMPDDWKLTLIESLNPEVLKTVYGDSNVTVDDVNHTIKVKATAETRLDAIYVIDMALKGGAMKRVVIPDGSLSEIGEIVYKGDEAIGYELTISALPDATGVSHYEYIKLASTSST